MGKKILNKIKITPLQIIKSPLGNVMHVLKKKELKNWSFGEAYFSEVEPKKIKAWKRHKEMTLNLIVPKGEIRFVLFDDSTNTQSQFQEVILSKKNYHRLTIPPMIWVGFQGLSRKNSMLLNIANLMHDPKEVDRKNINEIEFDWSA